MSKIVFNATENGVYVEIEQADGTFKKWTEELTDSEYAQISAAGMVMMKCTRMHAMLPIMFSNFKNPKRLVQIGNYLDKAEELVKKIFNIDK